ncbi:MAG: heavy-metal-associated domain-containing protein [Acidimicrobiia bacterium]
MTTRTYLVRGMTCSHCEQAVIGELSRLEGVRDVGVNLETGEVMVTSDRPLDDAIVRTAVDEAGYQLDS